MATLHLSESLLADLRARCEAAWPAEACGLLLGRWEPREGKGPKLVALGLHPSRNAGADPRAQFELAPEDFVAADTAAREGGLEIVGAWHSHADAPAVPSYADAAGAQESWCSLIVSVERTPDGPRATSCRCWSLEGGRMTEQRVCPC